MKLITYLLIYLYVFQTILSATAHQKEKLYAEYKNNKKLQLVDIVDWAGVGAVRFEIVFFLNL